MVLCSFHLCVPVVSPQVASFNPHAGLFEIEPTASHVLGKGFAAQLQPQPSRAHLSSVVSFVMFRPLAHFCLFSCFQLPEFLVYFTWEGFINCLCKWVFLFFALSLPTLNIFYREKPVLHFTAGFLHDVV